MAGWRCGQRARPKREVLPTERPTRRGNGTNGARGRPWASSLGEAAPSRIDRVALRPLAHAPRDGSLQRRLAALLGERSSENFAARLGRVACSVQS